MPIYTCNICNYVTERKSNINGHMLTKKHLERAQICANVYSNEIYSNDITCKYCNKKFKCTSSRNRHIKYHCKDNNNENSKELIRLLNKQLIEQAKHNDKKINSLQKQINILTNKLKITNINNGTINNISLNDYKDTDYSHLMPNDYIHSIRRCNYCVKNFIEKVHFNDKKPENRNIFISNLKNKCVSFYKENMWHVKDDKEALNDLYIKNEMILEDWYEEHKEKYPEIAKFVNVYLTNRTNNKIMNDVYKDIALMLYNNRLKKM